MIQMRTDFTKVPDYSVYFDSRLSGPTHVPDVREKKPKQLYLPQLFPMRLRLVKLIKLVSPEENTSFRLKEPIRVVLEVAE